MAGEYESHNSAKGFGIGQIVFVWIFGIFYSIGFSGLLVAYTLEVLPYHLRAKGVMIMNITVQAILALSAQTNPLAIHNLPHGWNFWLFYTVSFTLDFGAYVNDLFSNADGVCSCGMWLKQSGSTLCSPRLKALLSRRSPRSLMVRTPLLTSTWNKRRKRLQFIKMRSVMRRTFELRIILSVGHLPLPHQ